MENLGLRVIAEHPYRLDLGTDVAYIQDFEVEAATPDTADEDATNKGVSAEAPAEGAETPGEGAEATTESADQPAEG